MNGLTTCPVEGRYPPSASMPRYNMEQDKHDHLEHNQIRRPASPNGMSFCHPAWMKTISSQPVPNETKPTVATGTWISRNFVDIVSARQRGFARNNNWVQERGFSIVKALEARNIYRFDMSCVESLDKILASAWTSHNSVFFGTKQGQVFEIRMKKKKVFRLPVPAKLISTQENAPEQDHPPLRDDPASPSQQPGPAQPEENRPSVTSIELSPDYSVAAITMRHRNHIPIMDLDAKTPAVLAFDELLDTNTTSFVNASWATNSSLVAITNTGLCSVFNTETATMMRDTIFQSPIQRPQDSYACTLSATVTSACFNRDNKEFVFVMDTGDLGVFRTDLMKQTLMLKPAYTNCTAYCVKTQNKHGGLYAIGRMGKLSLLDPRTFHSVKEVPLRFLNAAVRSVSFADNVVAIGSSVGLVSLYDLRAGTALPFEEHSVHGTNLHCSSAAYDPNQARPDELTSALLEVPCIYTLNFNELGNYLFAAGGSMEKNVKSTFACYWW